MPRAIPQKRIAAKKQSSHELGLAAKLQSEIAQLSGGALSSPKPQDSGDEIIRLRKAVLEEITHQSAQEPVAAKASRQTPTMGVASAQLKEVVALVEHVKRAVRYWKHVSVPIGIAVLIYAGIYLFRIDRLVPVARSLLPWPVARVNGLTVWSYELQQHLDLLRHVVVYPSGQVFKQSELERLAVASIVRDAMVDEELANAGIAIRQDEVVARTAELQQSFGSIASFSEYLQKTFRLSIAEFANEVVAREVKLEKLRLYLNRNPIELAELQSRLLGAKTRILANEITFSQAAQEMSDDAFTRENGGAMGWVTYDALPQEFSSVLRSMKVGEISNPIKTDFGYHLLMLEDKRTLVGGVPELYVRQILAASTGVSEWLAREWKNAPVIRFIWM